MGKEVLFQRLYRLLQDTAASSGADTEANLVEAVLVSDLLSRWRDLVLELSGCSLEEFRSWATSRDQD